MLQVILFFFNTLKKLFIYLATSGLSCGTRDLLLWRVGFSLVVAYGLSCPATCGILVPRPWIKPASPALEGGFLTTGPPGKSQVLQVILMCTMKLTVETVENYHTEL